MTKIFLNVLFAVIMASLLANCDSEKSLPERSTVETSDTQKSDTEITLIWQEDLKTAFELAQKEQKNVLLMVEDERCRWCIKMKEGALSDVRVQKSLQPYILLKIDRADHKSMESLPGLRGPIPSFHFFTAEKKPIDKIAGYYEPEDFLGYIEEIAEESL